LHGGEVAPVRVLVLLLSGLHNREFSVEAVAQDLRLGGLEGHATGRRGRSVAEDRVEEVKGSIFSVLLEASACPVGRRRLSLPAQDIAVFGVVGTKLPKGAVLFHDVLEA